MSWDIGFELSGYKFQDKEWNYTHNCNEMMRAAGLDWIYNLHGLKVKGTLPQFELMLERLKADPERYIAMNPPNGWGDYHSLVAIWEEIIPEAQKIVEAIPEVTWWEWS